MPSVDKSCLIAGVELLDKIATSMVSSKVAWKYLVLPTSLLSLVLTALKLML